MISAAVVGGGVAGLAAARRLGELGVDVTVYEASHRPGGVVRSERSGDWLAEYGPNTIADPDAELERLFDGLGLAERWTPASPAARNRYILRRGRLVPLPLSPPQLLTTRLFSVRGKAAILREPFRHSRARPQDESVADFVRRRFGGEALDYAAAPFVGGVHAGDAELLSARHAFPRLVALESEYGSVLRGVARSARRRRASGKAPGSRLGSFPDGLGELPAALARALGSRLRLRAPVRAVTRVGGGWSVATDDAAQDHAAVVWAAPAHALARVTLECEGSELVRELARLPYAPVAVLALGFRREAVRHPLDGFGVLLPPVEGRRCLGVLFSSTLFPNRAPPDHALLTVFIGGARHPAAAALEPPALEALAMEELAPILHLRSDAVWRHHVRWPRAIPQYVLGHARMLEAMSALEGRNPGLALAGAYREGIALTDALRSGLRAAERIAGAAGSV
ncbi:MAG TPA: protoporphyrinogen oxidase [Gemmatimonadales bacterium]|nr:protoporphyrinogen oxidase [Gemmatimonadales bacterium]